MNLKNILYPKKLVKNTFKNLYFLKHLNRITWGQNVKTDIADDQSMVINQWGVLVTGKVQRSKFDSLEFLVYNGYIDLLNMRWSTGYLSELSKKFVTFELYKPLLVWIKFRFWVNFDRKWNVWLKYFGLHKKYG